jgi:hypothetical protein
MGISTELARITFCPWVGTYLAAYGAFFRGCRWRGYVIGCNSCPVANPTSTLITLIALFAVDRDASSQKENG